MSLTDKQTAFVEEYLKDFNATRAAERAGYGGDTNTLASIGSENLRKPKVRERIDTRLAETAMGSSEVLMRLADQARFDWGDFFTIDPENGKPKLDMIKAEARGKLRLIRRYWLDRNGNARVEFHDPQKALEMIGRAHLLFKDGVEVTGKDGRDLIPDSLRQALDKVYGAGVEGDGSEAEDGTDG